MQYSATLLGKLNQKIAGIEKKIETERKALQIKWITLDDIKIYWPLHIKIHCFVASPEPFQRRSPRLNNRLCDNLLSCQGLKPCPSKRWKSCKVEQWFGLSLFGQMHLGLLDRPLCAKLWQPWSFTAGPDCPQTQAPNIIWIQKISPS